MVVTDKRKRKLRPRRRRQRTYTKNNPSWFRKGNKGGPGRPRGAQNVVNVLIKEAVLEAGINAGDFLQAQTLCGSEGMVGYFEWLAIKYPAAYAGLIGRIYPSQVNVPVEDNRREPYQSFEEVQQALLRQGISPELIELIKAKPRLVFKPIHHDDDGTEIIDPEVVK
jgi:hypothetical protein